MKVILFDTETSGLPDNSLGFNKYHDYKKTEKYDSSRVVQLAMLVYERDDNPQEPESKDGVVSRNLPTIPQEFQEPVSMLQQLADKQKFKKVKECNYIIKPDGFRIENSDLHNITHELAEAVGTSIPAMVKDIIEDVSTANLIVAHNFAFDSNVLLSEMYRHKLYDEIKIFESVAGFCTSKECVNLCKIRFNAHEYKMPSLSDLYKFLFGYVPKNLHDAMVDTECLAMCFFELLNRKIFALN